MSRTKKSKAVPIVAVLTFLIAALAVVCFLINPLVIQPQKEAIAKAIAAERFKDTPETFTTFDIQRRNK